MFGRTTHSLLSRLGTIRDRTGMLKGDFFSPSFPRVAFCGFGMKKFIGIEEQTGRVMHFINNEFLLPEEDVSANSSNVTDPATQEIYATTVDATESEVFKAVKAADEALKSWRCLSPFVRARYFMDFLRILRNDTDNLASLISLEQGKTLEDARGDVFRGLEVVEYACGGANLLLGRTLSGVATDLDTTSYVEPIGICSGISPFNFPAMIPLWMFPLACVAGNTFILKPSERVPLTSLRLMELCRQAKLPKGVVNCVNGGRRTVDAILSSPDIKAVGFVGSNKGGTNIFQKGTARGKRVLSNMGAKNHVVVMPDAIKQDALQQIANAAFGAAGQRCMALTVAVLVGEANEWLPELVALSKAFKVGRGNEAGTDVGPLISQQAKMFVLEIINQACKEGATALLDGRNIVVDKYPNGNFVGPTILTNVSSDNIAYKTELFAPVLCVMTAKNLEQALDIINKNSYVKGNGCAIFTRSGSSAAMFQKNVNVGQVGINVPIPVPPPVFSFTGWNNSVLGDLHFYGEKGVLFFTRTKTVMSRWKQDEEIHMQRSGSFPTNQS